MQSEGLYRVGEAIDQETNERLEAISGELQGYSRRFKDWMQSSHLMQSGRDYAHATDQMVHDHSWKALGLAAVAGLCVGMMLSRRRY